jgi:hypothetical protein
VGFLAADRRVVFELRLTLDLDTLDLDLMVLRIFGLVCLWLLWVFLYLCMVMMLIFFIPSERCNAYYVLLHNICFGNKH